MSTVQARGMMLLIEGAPPGRRGRRESPESELAEWIGLAPVLCPGVQTDSIQLPQGTSQQIARGWLTRAGATRGPLVIHLSGHLLGTSADPHLALRPTTGVRARYEALPWSWIAAAIAPRPAGSTLIIADCTADAALLAALTAEPGPLGRAPMLAAVGPVPDHDAPHHLYASTLVAVLRRGLPGRGPTLTADQVHTEVTTLAALDPGTITMVPTVPVPHLLNTGSPAAAPAASPWTTAAHTPPPRPQPAPTAPSRPSRPAPTAPPPAPRGDEDRVQAIHDAAARGDATGALPMAVGYRTQIERRFPPSHSRVWDAMELEAWLLAQIPDRVRDAVHAYTRLAIRRAETLGDEHADVISARETARTLSRTDTTPTPQAAPPAPPTETPAPDTPRQSAAGGTLRDRVAEARRQAPPPTHDRAADTPPADVQPRVDAIRAADQAGDPTTAARLADALAADLYAAHGPTHPDVLHARELTALMRARTGRIAEAIEIHIGIARVRVTSLGPTHPQTRQAADNALALWLRDIPDDQAHVHGSALLDLRSRVPDDRARAHVRSRLDRIHRHATAGAAPPTPAPPPSPILAPQAAGARPTGPPAEAAPAPQPPPPPTSPPQAAESRPTGPPAEAAPAMTEIRAAAAIGDYPAAVAATEALIITMARVYGPEHAHTLAALDVRAQMLAAVGETGEALAVYVDLAQRLARHSPRDDTAIHDAAVAADRLWHRLGTTAAGLRAAHAVLTMHETAHPTGLAAAETHRDTIRATLTDRRRATD
ncbi:hypothetical protein [Embleya sp. NPDC005971]|uniref:hypothetical protein n=1 Tax=Embleya sp. NPDC005971 TaxID=3156724 RepID=UPI0033F6CDBF